MNESAVAIAGTIGFFAVVVVLIVQIAVTWRARLAVAQNQQYRDLVEKTVQAQEQAATEIGKLRDQVAEIERLMREVG